LVTKAAAKKAASHCTLPYRSFVVRRVGLFTELGAHDHTYPGCPIPNNGWVMGGALSNWNCSMYASSLYRTEEKTVVLFRLIRLDVRLCISRGTEQILEANKAKRRPKHTIISNKKCRLKVIRKVLNLFAR
jgi:hypothetical protein